jgi:hypothetical protein
MYCRSVEEVAEGMLSGRTTQPPTGTHSPNEEGRTRLIPASTAASTSDCPHHMSPPHRVYGAVKLAHLCDLVDFIVIPNSDD